MHYLRYMISFLRCCDFLYIHSVKLPDGYQWNYLFLSFFLSVVITKNYSCDQIKKNEMGGACGMYGRQERCVQVFGGET
jgi:hypothetical protein